MTRGGGAIALFGAPFFLAGVFMLLGAAGAIPMRTESGSAATMLVPMGLVFLAVGGVMVFGRQRLILDLGRRSILRQISVLVPLRTQERALSEFQAVVISFDPGDSESPETYPVKLRALTGKDAAIVKPLLFAESLAAAEYLARTLSLQLIDATTDREIVVSTERVGEPLRNRLSRASTGTPPQRPPTIRSEVTESAAETRIVMPGGGPTIARYAGLYLPIIVFAIAMGVATPYLMRSQKPLTLFCMLLVVFGAPTVFAIVHYMITSRRKGVTVTAATSGLVIEEFKSGKLQSTTIAASEVFDVDYSTFESAVESARQANYFAARRSAGDERFLQRLRKLVPNRGIIIKSRSGLITVGEGLPSDELQYLAWLIRTALIG